MRVFVTTAPRKKPTLRFTLDSLLGAGFTDIAVRSGLTAFTNWFGCLQEGACLGEQFAIAQDDILVSRGLAGFIGEVDGVASYYRSPKPGWGACFYVLSPDSAEKLAQLQWHSDREIDTFVYQSCKRLSIPFWQPECSYVLHVGETSTLGDGLTNTGWRQALDFREEA